MTNKFRTPLSLGLALTVVNLFTLGSLASAPERIAGPAALPSDGVIAPGQVGVTGNTAVLNARGRITINGSDAKPGSTVLSGNTVATGSGSYASTEMGPALGRIELRSDTTVASTFA